MAPLFQAIADAFDIMACVWGLITQTIHTNATGYPGNQILSLQLRGNLLLAYVPSIPSATHDKQLPQNNCYAFLIYNSFLKTKKTITKTMAI
jgi:hypothetical protein